MKSIHKYENIELVATHSDHLDEIIEIEWDPSNNDYVYKWTKDQHQEVIDSDDWYHLLIRDSTLNKTVGYVMLDGVASPHKCIELTRIAIKYKGQGYGGAAVSAIQELCFDHLKCHRLWLDVYSENSVAKALYMSKGFVYEGTLRENKMKNGNFHSMDIMSQLKHEFYNK